MKTYKESIVIEKRMYST